VILWGTGLGSARENEITVELGGVEIFPDYAGPAPGFPGLDQINFRLPPSGILDGCYVPLVVKAPTNIISIPGGPDRVASNELTIAKSSIAGPCRHPFILTENQLSALDSGQRLVFASAQLRSFTLNSASSSSARIDFNPKSALEVELLSREGSAIAPGACTVARGVAKIPIPVLITGEGDAGPWVKLTGPETTLQVPGLAGSGLYSAPYEAGFTPGVWRLEAPGGTVVGAFQTEQRLPPTVRWRNREELANIDLSRDLHAAWDGAGYTDADLATFTVQSILASAQCHVLASAGGVTIPADLMKQLQPPIQLGLEVQFELRPLPERRKQFSMPLANGDSGRGIFDHYFLEIFDAVIR
jgi:hypothetical protein